MSGDIIPSFLYIFITTLLHMKKINNLHKINSIV